VSTPWSAHAALLLVQLFFGMLPILGKLALRGMSPMALVYARIIGASILLLILARAFRFPTVATRAEHTRLLLFGFLGVFANQVFFLEGLSRTTAINAAILTTSIPVFTTLISVGLKQEKGSWLKLLGIGVSLAGALLLVGVRGFDFTDRYLVGNLLILCNTVSYSFYMVLSKPFLKRYPPSTVITGAFSWSALLMLPLYPLAWGEVGPTQISSFSWGMVGAIIVFPTVGSYLLNSYALQRTQPSVVAAYIYLQPLVSVSLGMFFLEERLPGTALLAAILIFSGLALVGRARRRDADAL
jgi:drug/metabolite transporter (DMT)-like permease